MNENRNAYNDQLLEITRALNTVRLLRYEYAFLICTLSLCRVEHLTCKKKKRTALSKVTELRKWQTKKPFQFFYVVKSRSGIHCFIKKK